MAEKINDGGGAFPHNHHEPSYPYTRHAGLSIRDYFAGQALVAMGTWTPGPSSAGNLDEDMCQRRAAFAYKQADAMLAARAALRTAEGEGK